MRRQLPGRRMREHPDLEQLKRQAKELLRAFTAGEAEAAAEVGALYGGAHASTFALHDAQLVIARSYGFASWPKLKAYVDGVTVRRLAEAVRAERPGAGAGAMLRARPELADLTDVVWRRAPAHPFCGDESPARDGAAAHASRRECAGGHSSAPGRDQGVDHRQGASATTRLSRSSRKKSGRRGPWRARPTGGRGCRRCRARAGGVSGDAGVAARAPRRGNAHATRSAGTAAACSRWQCGTTGPRSYRCCWNTGSIRMNASRSAKAIGWRTRRDIRSGTARRWAGARWRRCCSRAAPIPNVHVDSSGSAVHSAYSHRQWEMVELLRRHGGVVSADTAAIYRQTGLAKQMLSDESRGTLGPGIVSPGKPLAEELLNFGAMGGDPQIVRLALERIDLAAGGSAVVPVGDGAAFLLAPHSVAVRGESRAGSRNVPPVLPADPGTLRRKRDRGLRTKHAARGSGHGRSRDGGRGGSVRPGYFRGWGEDGRARRHFEEHARWAGPAAGAERVWRWCCWSEARIRWKRMRSRGRGPGPGRRRWVAPRCWRC